jgi:hypothetical protein
VVSFTPRPLYLLGKSHRYPLDRRLGPRVDLDDVEKRKIWHLPGFKPRPSSALPVAIPTEISLLLLLLLLLLLIIIIIIIAMTIIISIIIRRRISTMCCSLLHCMQTHPVSDTREPGALSRRYRDRIVKLNFYLQSGHGDCTADCKDTSDF